MFSCLLDLDQSFFVMNISDNDKIDLPPNVFFIFNFSLALLISFIGITLCTTLLIIIVRHRKYHTISNLLACNTSIAIISYLILTAHASIYGFREDWALHAPLCIPRAYLFTGTIATVCYSFAIQSLSRLFFTIYYQYRCLVTWRLHRLLIVINWLIGFTIPLYALFQRGSLEFERQSRVCVLKTNHFSVAIFSMITIIFIPVSITTVIYRQLFDYSRQSTDRILRTSRFMNTRRVRLNVRRDLKLAQQLLIQTTCASGGGMIFLFNIFWQAFCSKPLPNYLFLLGYILMTVGMGMISIAHFLLNKKVKKLVWKYICRRRY